jgi:hypothetical protein
MLVAEQAQAQSRAGATYDSSQGTVGALVPRCVEQQNVDLSCGQCVSTKESSSAR